MGLLGWLGLLFVGLKLGGVVAWSWWLVLAPWYALPALVAGFLALGVLGVLGKGVVLRVTRRGGR